MRFSVDRDLPMQNTSKLGSGFALAYKVNGYVPLIRWGFSVSRWHIPAQYFTEYPPRRLKTDTVYRQRGFLALKTLTMTSLSWSHWLKTKNRAADTSHCIPVNCYAKTKRLLQCRYFVSEIREEETRTNVPERFLPFSTCSLILNYLWPISTPWHLPYERFRCKQE